MLTSGFMRLVTYLFIVFLAHSSLAQPIQVGNPVRFLALGDSYTFGQGVSLQDRWPAQFATELTNLNFQVDEMRVIAQTGWTTSALQQAINQQMPIEGYNLVSLLIGVNNQFFGGSIQTYSAQFQALLEQAIALAGGNPARVFVLSIPDYAYTPFGNGNPAISAEIDAFNNANRTITAQYQVRYVDVTPISRLGLQQPELVASDNLHPSALMYRLWVEEILQYVEKELNVGETRHEKPVVFHVGNQLVINFASPAKFIISNLSGSVLLQGSLNGEQPTSVSMNPYPNGVYVLQIDDGRGNVSATKILLYN
jgi:lysophospholipase L1-like esterase